MFHILVTARMHSYFPKCLYQECMSSYFSTSLSTFAFVCPPHFSYLGGYEVASHYDLISISLMVISHWTSFHVLIYWALSSLEKCIFTSCLRLLSCNSSLDILNTIFLSDTCLQTFFSNSMGSFSLSLKCSFKNKSF